MSAPRFVDPAAMAAPGGHYSHAVCAGGLVYVSGQLPITADGHRLTGAPFEAQARQVLANVEQALLACGSSPSRLLQVRVYLTDIDNWPLFNRLYSAWLGDLRPARAVVPVPVLHHGLAVEMEAVAQA
ncbi:MAG: RidA family protein [Microvirgula sp.]